MNNLNIVKLFLGISNTAVFSLNSALFLKTKSLSFFSFQIRIIIYFTYNRKQLHFDIIKAIRTNMNYWRHHESQVIRFNTELWIFFSVQNWSYYLQQASFTHFTHFLSTDKSNCVQTHTTLVDIHLMWHFYYTQFIVWVLILNGLHAETNACENIDLTIQIH